MDSVFSWVGLTSSGQTPDLQYSRSTVLWAVQSVDQMFDVVDQVQIYETESEGE